MWDDVIIGEGSKGNTATIVWKSMEPDGCSISASAAAYWVSRAYLNAGMTIFKDTLVGRELKRLLDRGAPEYEVAAFLAGAVLTNARPIVLERLIGNCIQEAYARGRKDKANEIQAALRPE